MRKCYVRLNNGKITEAYKTGKTHKVSSKIEGTRFTSKYTFVRFVDKLDAKDYMISDHNLVSEKEYGEWCNSI